MRGEVDIEDLSEVGTGLMNCGQRLRRAPYYQLLLLLLLLLQRRPLLLLFSRWGLDYVES